MATDKQIAANRANAQLSSGPKTPEGKAKSSLNAYKHGFSASHATVAREKDDEFYSILNDLAADFQPEGEFECSQVETMAVAEWRHRRARRYDTGLADIALAHLRKTRENLSYPDDPPYDDQQAWSDPNFIERRETRLLGETFDKCGMALLRNAHYSAKYRREYDNAYSKLIINQDHRRRQASQPAQSRTNKPAA